MKILANDIFTGEVIELTGTLTTDHPASSYGQPVLFIDEWNGDAMSFMNWQLAGCKVVEIAEDEKPAMQRWLNQFPV